MLRNYCIVQVHAVGLKISTNLGPRLGYNAAAGFCQFEYCGAVSNVLLGERGEVLCRGNRQYSSGFTIRSGLTAVQQAVQGSAITGPLFAGSGH